MIVLSFLLITLISLLTLKTTFNLALFGDDWLAFSRYLEVLGPNSTQGYNHITYFLTLYGPQDILMGGVLRPIFGFNSSLYFLTSYLFRLLAAFSLYPLIHHLTRNRLAAFFGCLFFSITIIGFDTTNWVFNMPSYLSLASFSLYLYFLLRSFDNPRFLIPLAFFLYLAFILAPIRMTGVIPITFATVLFLFIQKKLSLKKILLTGGTVLTVFIFTTFSGESFGPGFAASGNFKEGLAKCLELWNNGQRDFILNPLIILGGMIIPDLLLTNSGNILKKSQLLINLLIPGFIIFSSVIILIITNVKSLIRKKSLFLIFFSAFILNLFVFYLYQYKLSHFSGNRQIIYILVSGYLLILLVTLIINNFKKTSTSSSSLSLFISLAVTILAFIYPWWKNPDLNLETTHRYLIVSSIGISLLFSTIISLGSNLKNQLALAAFCSIFLILNYLSVQKYTDTLLGSHSQELANKIWLQIPYFPEIKTEKGPFLFYITGDNTNGNILHDVITFGFSPHMALIYNRELYHVLPADTFDELLSDVKDGQGLKRHGQTTNPVPLNHIYSFNLSGKDHLINTTEETKDNLLKLLNTI